MSRLFFVQNRQLCQTTKTQPPNLIVFWGDLVYITFKFTFQVGILTTFWVYKWF